MVYWSSSFAENDWISTTSQSMKREKTWLIHVAIFSEQPCPITHVSIVQIHLPTILTSRFVKHAFFLYGWICEWVRGCFHEKTRTGASFIPVWLFYFVSGLHVVYMMTGSFHTSLFEGTLHVDKINVRFNITHALPVPVYWQTDSHRNVWSFRVYMIPLRDFVPEWNSRPSTTTWVNSRRVDSRRDDILWWHHVNKCRAMRGNRSGLVPARTPGVM